jgi:anhydro-N-acetylmuramic acid kinase
MTRKRTIVGVMTGTSIDAVDVAAVSVSGSGLDISADQTAFQSFSLEDIAKDLRAIAGGAAFNPSVIAKVESDFGELIAESIASLTGSEHVDLAVVHGQTIYHKPPLTWQLLNPWPIAAKLGIPVLYDLRRADIALHGQGAPLTPIADAVLFGHTTKKRAVVNLGGFSNITLLPKMLELSGAIDQICGFDICPCNHWLDGVLRARTDLMFDDQGMIASSGSVIDPLATRLYQKWLGSGQSRRSLGSEDDLLFELPEDCTADLLATCCDVIAQLIAHSSKSCDEILCAGGSVRNTYLMSRIRMHSSVPVVDLRDAGVEPDAREAAAFAVLGSLCSDSVPIGLPNVTGVSRPIVSGSWCLPLGPDRLFHA